MSLRDIAEAAGLELDEHGWCKYSFEDPDGRICLSTALWRARVSCDAGNYHYYYGDVREVMADLFPDRKCGVIMFFNDHPDTTREDISLVLKHLAERG